MGTELEPLEKESDKAFAAFRAYVDLGPQRSLAGVAARLGKHKSLMERWSRRHGWIERLVAYERRLAKVERQAIEALALEKAVEWHRIHEAVKVAEWQRHQKLIALADEMIARWEQNKDKCGTLEGIARLLELATKLGRLASGLPNEVKEVNTTMKATIDVDWEMAIRKAYGGATKDAETPEEAVVDVEEVKG